MKNTIISILVLAVLGLGLAYFLHATPAAAPATDDTQTGVNPEASSYTYVNASGDVILPDSPAPESSVPSTFTVTGRAVGPWYFEASFPVEVLDGTGAVIAQTHATAEGDWMTDALVPFSADVAISGSYTGPATLVLHNDNPSGDPAHDASVSYAIVIQ